MAIEATFTDSQFPLAAVFSALPDVQIELDRVIPTDTAIVPYFWVQGADAAGIDTSDIDHPGIRDTRVIDTVGNDALVRVEWNLEHESVLTAILETDVVLVSAIGKRDKWTFNVRGDDHQVLSDFRSYCQEHDIPVELTQLHALSPLHSDQESDLTDAQREVLTLAYARGYYDSPRRVPQQAIADELGITRQAVASRLQRGTRRLVASTLITSDE